MGWSRYSFRMLRALWDRMAGLRPAGLGEGPGEQDRDQHLLLKLVGQEQELATCQAAYVKLAEALEHSIDLLLADPRPLLDTEDEDGWADAGVIWT